MECTQLIYLQPVGKNVDPFLEVVTLINGTQNGTQQCTILCTNE